MHYLGSENQRANRQDSPLDGTTNLKSLILEYAIIKQNARRRVHANVFLVHGSQWIIEICKRYPIIAVEHEQ
jgi:hypothetical protein